MVIMNKEQALELLNFNYSNIESPIFSANEELLYEYFKDSLTRKEIKKYLESIPHYTKTRRFVNKFNRNYIFSPRKRYMLQADLKDISSLSRENKGYKFILIVIESFTRKAWAILLKTKTEKEVSNAFSQVLERTGFFNHLVTDRGTEFYNKTFRQLMNEWGINHYSPLTQSHAAYAERFIRTLMNIIYKWISKHKTNKFVNHFDAIVQSYNDRKHRIIGMSPENAESGAFDIILYRNIKKYRDSVKKQSPTLHVNDLVRLKLPKTVFSKGYKQSSTNEIFRVIKVNTKHKIPLYTLANNSTEEKVKGQFYSTELQKVRE